MAKRAIALGGGGVRGPYQIGVWKALNELSIDYSIVTGTSVGAINGAFFVQQEYDTAKKMWESLTTHDVIAEIPDEETLASQKSRALLSFLKQSVEHGGMDVTPLENLLRKAIDEDAVRRSPIEYGIVTTRVPDISPVQLLKSEIPQGEMVDYILASAACFPIFQQRDINGQKYIDGAYSDNVPANFAASCGAEEIIAVDLRGLGIIRSYKYEQDIPVTYIRSYWDLGKMFIFEAENTKRCMRLGYQDAMKAYRRLEGKAYAFFSGETRRNSHALNTAFNLAKKRSGVNLFREYEIIPKTFDSQSPIGSLFLRPDKQRYTLGHSVTTAAEIAGELLKVPPDKVYTFGEFNRIIYKKSTFLRNLPDELENLDRESAGYLLRKIYKRLKHAYATGKLSDSFWGLTAISPKSFIAAYYILVIEIYSANL